MSEVKPEPHESYWQCDVCKKKIDITKYAASHCGEHIEKIHGWWDIPNARHTKLSNLEIGRTAYGDVAYTGEWKSSEETFTICNKCLEGLNSIISFNNLEKRIKDLERNIDMIKSNKPRLFR